MLHLSPCSLTVDVWALPVAPELADLEGTEEEDPELLVNNQSWLDGESEREVEKDAQPGPKRRARQLTEEDLPVNDYVSVGNHILGVSWTWSWGVLALLLGMSCSCFWGVLVMFPGWSGHAPGVSWLCPSDALAVVLKDVLSMLLECLGCLPRVPWPRPPLSPRVPLC